MRELNVGLIGYGFMGKAHSQAYRNLNNHFDVGAKVNMKCICGLPPKSALAQAAKEFGWESCELNWRKLVARDDIDIIDISSPQKVHVDQAVEAAKAGKHIICEKPMASTLAEAKKMVAAVKKAKVKNMVGFNYRRIPAVKLAHDMIKGGKLGTIRHFRAVYLQDWITDPDFPLVWRLKKSESGSGALGDIGSHILDLGMFLVGDIDSVAATTKTFIKERPVLAQAGAGLAAKGGKKKGRVTVDDAVAFLAHFKNGAMGTFEGSRFALGRKNHIRFEINGSKGSLVFDLEDLNRLEYYDGAEDANYQGFRSILVTEPTHPYLEGWWPPGHIIGWQHTFVHEFKDFVEAIVKNKKIAPSFEDGLKVEKVQDAVERAAKSRKWVKA